MPLNTPLVSVIVPAYNAERHLERTLRSALAQTMGLLEIIVVDDASSDQTSNLALQLGVSDRRIRVLRNESNLGPSSSRNLAIDASHGEWIALLDADDSWLPNRLEEMLAMAGEADVISDDILKCRTRSRWRPQECRSLLVDSGLALSDPHRLTPSEFVGHNLGLLKPLIRRSALQRVGVRYDPKLRRHEDYVFAVELLAAGVDWIQLPFAYYLYTPAEGSLTSDAVKLASAQIEGTRRLLCSPRIVSDSDLAAVLHRRLLHLLDFRTYLRTRSLVRRRNAVALFRMVRADPRTFMHSVIIAMKLRYYALRRLWRRSRSRHVKHHRS